MKILYVLGMVGIACLFFFWSFARQSSTQVKINEDVKNTSSKAEMSTENKDATASAAKKRDVAQNLSRLEEDRKMFRANAELELKVALDNRLRNLKEIADSWHLKTEETTALEKLLIEQEKRKHQLMGDMYDATEKLGTDQGDLLAKTYFDAMRAREAEDELGRLQMERLLGIDRTKLYLDWEKRNMNIALKRSRAKSQGKYTPKD